MRRIALRVGEIADAYALENLYRALQFRLPDDNIYFNVRPTQLTAKKILRGYAKEADLFLSKPDLVIQVYSDTTENLSRYERGPYKTFFIDVSVLKACRPLPGEEALLNIRNRHGLRDVSRPIAVFGSAYTSHSEDKTLITNLAGDVHFAMVPQGGFSSVERLGLSENVVQHLDEFAGFGDLADLYAIADLAFVGVNLKRREHNFMGNFYEQTQGGPIFIVPSAHSKQYGYDAFVENGLVRCCTDIDDIVNQSQIFLRNFSGNGSHKQLWVDHWKMTTETELPKILDCIAYAVNAGNASTFFTYLHPASGWEQLPFVHDSVGLYGVPLP